LLQYSSTNSSQPYFQELFWTIIGNFLLLFVTSGFWNLFFFFFLQFFGNFSRNYFELLGTFNQVGNFTQSLPQLFCRIPYIQKEM
jgi:hypothetical protein